METEVAKAGSADGTPLDPFDPEFYAHMHERLAVLRTQGPVHYISQLQTWCTTTYADSELVFRDSRFVKRGWAQMVDTAFGCDTILGDFLFFKDPPDHTRLRRLVQKAFRTSTINTLANRAVSVADQLIEDLRRAGGADLVKDFAWQVPVPVVGSLLDVPQSDSAMIGTWGRDLFLATDMTRPDRLPAGQRALAEMYAYFSEHLQRCRLREEGFIAALVAASIDEDRLSDHEVVVMCLQLLIGGYDTTAHQIASGAYLLLSHPDQLRQLREDWSLLGNAVEEILRCEPSAPFLGRAATTEITLGEKTIHAGEFIGPLVAAANRDPARFPDPNQFDIATPRPTHLSFGSGIRRCLGEHLAQLNLRTAMSRLFRSEFEITLEQQTPRWRPSLLFRGLESLPASFG
jgi:pimeloyl-[acyl-carrier protein] synthase